MSHTKAIREAQDALQRIREAVPRDPVLDTDFDLVEAALKNGIRDAEFVSEARSWGSPAPKGAP